MNDVSRCSLCHSSLQADKSGVFCVSCDDPNEEGVTFRQWKKRVDYFIRLKSGMISRDLPDQRYRDWYDEGREPQQAALTALELVAADFGLDLEYLL